MSGEKGQRCKHRNCKRYYADQEYLCDPVDLPAVIVGELSGEWIDAKCWPDESLSKAEVELTRALELVRAEMLARRSNDGPRVAEAFHPGVHIADEVEARGWKVGCLEHASGVNRWVLDQIMSGHGVVTEEVADGLAEAFGSDAQMWLNLQAMYDEYMNAKRAEL